MTTINWNGYLGTWYELMHYPTWFQPNDAYNTTATYSMNSDGTIRVNNATMIGGFSHSSIGSASIRSSNSLRVDFPMPEVAKLTSSGKFAAPAIAAGNEDNYIIGRVWSAGGEYYAVVVTDSMRSNMWVLCRTAHPSAAMYGAIMRYIGENFDRAKLVQTPHY